MYKRFKKLVYAHAEDYEKFADIVGWKSRKVNFLASEKQKITIEIANELKEKLNINPCWLVFNQGEMYLPKIDLEQDLKSEEETESDIDKLKKEIEEIKQLLTKRQ